MFIEGKALIMTTVLEALQRTLEDADAAQMKSQEDRTALLPLMFTAHFGGRPIGRGTSDQGDAQKNEGASAPERGSGSLSSIAAWLDITEDEVEGCFGDAGEGPQVTISPRRLAGSKADATRQLAQLVLAMRQATGIDEYTSVGEIRTVVNDFGKLDSSNFAAHLGALDAVATAVGRGSSKKLKVTRVGREKIAELVRELAKDD